MSQQSEEKEEQALCNIKDMEARLADLIIYRDQARRRIAELEATVANLLGNFKGEAKSSEYLRHRCSAPLLDQPFKEDSMQQISQWNKELVETVNELRSTMLKMETDAKVQTITLKDKVEQLQEECESLRRENDALKERVADDVLRQRQTNRVEIAFERARIASRVRAAGLRRLENMEAILMETHDDLYFVQRFDGAKLPVREVTFVMHVVVNNLLPSVSGEEFTMDMYQKLLLGAARKHKGYHVCSTKQMEVFAFHSATAALNFSGLCHLAVTKVAWPYRTTETPYFAPIIEDGEVLYSGPRVHTCIYTCNPGSEVDPINGRSVYYGEEIRLAILAALKAAPVGEIVANKAWGQMFCKEMNILNDKNVADVVDVNCMREKLGPKWSVVTFDSNCQELFCSILPKTLENRRGLPPYCLHPTPRFPQSVIDVDASLSEIIFSIKSVRRLSCDNPQRSQQQQQHHHHHQNVYQEGWVEGIYREKHYSTEKGDTNGTELFSLYRLRREKANIISIYKKLEAVCEVHEQTAMEAEDWFFARLRSIDPTETLFVCAVDVGDCRLWEQVTNTLLNADEQYRLRDQLQSVVFSGGEKYDGIYVNGNNRDIFIFAFRYSEQALRFVTHLYTVLSQIFEKLTKSEICLMRAGISMGNLRSVPEVPLTVVSSFISSSSSSLSPFFSDVNKTSPVGNAGPSRIVCRGTAMNISCKLCVSAKIGEILATGDVIQAFYATKTNLLGMEYNILREASRFLGSHSALVDVYSILPKLYAYRRQNGNTENQALKLWSNSRRDSFNAACRPEKFVMRYEDMKQFMRQEQQFVEGWEAAMMSSLDEFAVFNPQWALRLPWPVISKLCSARRGIKTANAKKLGFFFCCASETSAIARATSDELYKEVMSHYNHTVKEAVMAHDGFVAKTDSATAYIVIFSEPYRALEAALQIQRQLLAFAWPNKLQTIEATLYVRSAKSGVVLFRGVRAQMAVHVSGDCQCTRAGSGVNSVLSVVGSAFQTVAELGYQASGGEILVTQEAITNMQSTVHGSLLLNQLAFRVASLPAIKEASAVGSCVPRLLIERFNLFRPVANGSAAKSKLPAVVSKLRQVQRVTEASAWWQDANNCVAPLPPSRALQVDKNRGSSRKNFYSFFLQSLEDAAGYLKQESVESSDSSSSPRDNLMSVFRDIISGLSNIFKMLDDASHKPAVAAAPEKVAAQTQSLSAPLVLRTPLQAGNTIASASSDATTASSKKRNVTSSLSKLTIGSNSSKKTSLIFEEVHARALLALDGMLKGLVQRVSRAVGGSANSMYEQALPNMRQRTKKKAAYGNVAKRNM